MTALHAGGKFGGGAYKVSGGLHGVGVSIVNALSKHLRVQVCRDGYQWTQEYEHGRPIYDLRKGEKTRDHGTTVEWTPNPEIFETLELDFDLLVQRFREMAFLIANTHIHLTDGRTGQRMGFYFEGGTRAFVTLLGKRRTPLHPDPICIRGQVETTQVDIAIQYCDTVAEQVLTFANTIRNNDGGTHLTGFRTALTRSLNEYARKQGTLKDNDPNLTGEDVREGLTAVVSVMIPEPQFEGQTKTKKIKTTKV